MRPMRAVLQSLQPVGPIPAQPAVIALPADPVVAAGSGHAATDLLNMPQHRQPALGASFQLTFSHADLLESGDPTVNNLRQF